jgi:Zn-dependent peptidase ImmA (M78 family)
MELRLIFAAHFEVSARSLLFLLSTRQPFTASSRREKNMTQAAANQKSSDQLPADLVSLMQAIDQLPAQYREQLANPLQKVVEYTKRRRKILDLIQEALSQLRLDLKYLMFDLEATRRERDLYKSNLEGGL